MKLLALFCFQGGIAVLTCQRLIFRRYREPASENVTSQREKEMRKIVTSKRSTRNTSTQLSVPSSYSGTRKRNGNITSDHQADIKRAKKAEYNKRYREKQAFLTDVDTSNCKAMISMIKATCFLFDMNMS